MGNRTDCRLRILVYSTYLNRPRKTGIEVYAEELISRLVRLNGDFWLLAHRPTEIEGGNVTEMLIPDRGKILPLVWAIPRLMTRLKADVFFNPGQYTYFARRQRSVIVVHDVAWKYFQDYFSIAKRYAFDFLTRHAVHHATRIVADSQTTRNDLIRLFGCDPAKIRVVYLGFDSGTFSPEGRNDADVLQRYGLNDRRYMLYLGTLQKRKNLLALLKTFEYSGLQDVLLVLAGGLGWFAQDILNEVNNSPKKALIRLTGYVSNTDKPALYRNSILFAYPSLYEGFGFPVLEAMACGTTVLKSPNSAMSEIVKIPDLLVDPNGAQQMASRLKYLCANGEIYKAQLLARAQDFSWDKCLQEILETLVEASEAGD